MQFKDEKKFASRLWVCALIVHIYTSIYVHACMNASQVREVRTMKDNSYNIDHLYLKWFKEFE